MTTATITPGHNRIDYTATLLADFHHGAGNAGNTSLLRTQDVAQPDGTVARVPFLSGASIRHGLRDALAWHLADTLDLAEGSLSKTAVDLLWSGGAVTKTGAETNLEMARRVDTDLPMLSLLGYAAQSDITTGTLRASDAILICQENAWRLPDEDGLRRAAAFRGEKFGTRHDIAATPIARMIDISADLTGSMVTTTQMIYDTQTLISGARLAGHLSLTAAATGMHRVTLDAARHLWAPGGEAHLGGKTAQGYGHARIQWADGGPAPDALDVWTDHVTTYGDAILSIITELAA